MNKWISHVTGVGSADVTTPGHANRSYPWKSVSLDTDEEILLTRLKSRESISSDSLRHIDINSDGLYIWLIKENALVHWKSEDYGVFYEEDCFLLLQIRELLTVSDKPTWTLHLWLGRHVTEELYQSAVYQTISLNSCLQYEAIVQRDIQGFESTLLKSYFTTITYLKGSADDSYWNAERQNTMYRPRLLKGHKPDFRYNLYTFTEVPCHENELNTSFAYVLDLGRKLYQWNGDLCKTEDTLKTARYVEHVRCCRGLDIEIQVVEDDRNSDMRHSFYTFLSSSSVLGEDFDHPAAPSSSQRTKGVTGKGQLYRVFKNKGRVRFKKIKDGEICQKDVSSEETCLIDYGELCVLSFKRAVAPLQRGLGLILLQEYLMTSADWLRPAAVMTEEQLTIWPLLENKAKQPIRLLVN